MTSSVISSLVGIIPVAVAGGVALKFADEIFDDVGDRKPRKRKKSKVKKNKKKSPTSVFDVGPDDLV